MGAICSLKDVVKEYHLGTIVVPAVRGVSLEIAQGEFSTIAGPSGSGKTTLLNLIGCVDTATEGSVTVADQVTNDLSDRALTNLRLHTVGFIFQSFNLLSVLSAFDNVAMPLLLQNTSSAKERDERTESMLRKVGLGDHMHHRPNELSGGQRQRVAIARALVTRPRLVLADEPTANLDSETGAAIIGVMKEINESDGTTFLFSTHAESVMALADRVIRLVDGRIVP